MNFTGLGFDCLSSDADPNARKDHDDAPRRNDDGGGVHGRSLL